MLNNFNKVMELNVSYQASKNDEDHFLLTFQTFHKLGKVYSFVLVLDHGKAKKTHFNKKSAYLNLGVFNIVIFLMLYAAVNKRIIIYQMQKLDFGKTHDTDK
jgi:hypothetical protein